MSWSARYFYLLDAIANKSNLDNENARIWSYQFDLDKPETRRFMVMDVDTFWHEYTTYENETTRHHEEVTEPHLPCRLYLDLEYNKAANPSIKPAEISQFIERWISNALKKILGVDYTRSMLLKLDSSSNIFKDKWSQHWIYELPRNLCFQNNKVVWQFVQTAMKDSVTSEARKDDELCDLLVKRKDGIVTWVVDTGVYSNHQSLRLFQSSKLRQKNPLLVFEPELTFPGREPSEKEIFQRSLLCMCPNDLHTVLDQVKFNKRLMIQKKSIQFRQHTLTENIKSFNSFSSARTYPKQMHFVNRYIILAEPKASVYRVTLFENKNLVVELNGKPLFCFNVRRPHIKNHTSFVFDLDNDTVWQKCYDSVCHDSGYKSQAIRLPHKKDFQLSELRWPFCMAANEYQIDDSLTDD